LAKREYSSGSQTNPEINEPQQTRLDLADGVSNYLAAVETYKKLLEQIPDDKDIQARLEWLQQQ